MAVRIDIEAFRQSVPALIADAADRLVEDGAVGDLESSGGGVQAEVAEVQTWVGIVDGEIAGDCDCGSGERLCAHAVALALTAVRAGFPLLASATPPGPDTADPEQARYLTALRRLTGRQVAALVVDTAVRDRLFAARLLGEAGLLDADAAAAGLEDFRAAIDAASEDDDAWEGGARLAEEAEILLQYPATTAALELMEDALQVWDELSVEIADDPVEITEALVEGHRELCDRLGLDESEGIARLDRVAASVRNGTIVPSGR
ncbi:hypothetical protein J2S43_001306 [Catenuloplanes nepalensis]|uniref:SWIM-type domain-containing protein n=1 Tax=Catenuloplanes nepalensis TaxID=587533 RepID=A0ABT9MMY5_9ACTN|nr:hypothetical protein [Catenuloplanes nepalensis]MDP9792794.1 hypothetical protein [Catenuloplanes nepalensis]